MAFKKNKDKHKGGHDFPEHLRLATMFRLKSVNVNIAEISCKLLK